MADEMKSVPVDAMAQIVKVLMPLSSEDRKKVIKAALTLLGEDRSRNDGSSSSIVDASDELDDTSKLPQRARTWMRQNDVTSDHLEQVFHQGEEGFEVIASHMPGNNKKEQTYNAYILSGLSALLASGSPIFQDKSARALCESSGCYDPANHSTHISKKRVEFTGSKEKGWTLTSPGLKRAAEIIKDLNQ